MSNFFFNTPTPCLSFSLPKVLPFFLLGVHAEKTYKNSPSSFFFKMGPLQEETDHHLSKAGFS